MEESTKKHLVDWIIPVVCLGLAVATVAIVYFLHRDESALERLTIVVEYVIVILVFFFGLMVLIRMATNTIDISGLLCDPGQDKASMSRFQLLIFTFVIAFSLLLIIVSGKEPQFPQIPSGILLLLGISASTYAVSKGMTSSSGNTDGDGQPPAKHQTASTTKDERTGKTTTRVHDHATGHSTTTVHDPATGETTTTVHKPTTVTTTTTVDPPPPVT
jgi:hypothetical protein